MTWAIYTRPVQLKRPCKTTLWYSSASAASLSNNTQYGFGQKVTAVTARHVNNDGPHDKLLFVSFRSQIRQEASQLALELDLSQICLSSVRLDQDIRQNWTEQLNWTRRNNSNVNNKPSGDHSVGQTNSPDNHCQTYFIQLSTMTVGNQSTWHSLSDISRLCFTSLRLHARPSHRVEQPTRTNTQ